MTEDKTAETIESIVHENVDAAVRSDNLVHRGRDLIGFTDVADDAERGAAGFDDIRDNAFDAFGGPRKNCDLRAFGRKQFCGGAANAAACASDNGNFSIESTHVYLHLIRLGNLRGVRGRQPGRKAKVRRGRRSAS